MAQMAATAGSVAVGSVVGHGLSNMLFGGTSDGAQQQTPQRPGGCEAQAKGIMFACQISIHHLTYLVLPERLQRLPWERRRW